VLVAYCLNPAAASLLSWQTADLASMKRLNLGRFNQCGNGFIAEISMETESAKLLLDLEHLKLAAVLRFSGGNYWLQALAQPPKEIEPPIAVLESKVHHRMSGIAANVEPCRPPIYQFLLKLSSHIEAIPIPSAWLVSKFQDFHQKPNDCFGSR